jgi:segregation and condensation protein A
MTVLAPGVARPTGAGPTPFGAAGDPFSVELERFQGPLDLLLHLIRSQDIDIFEIPIAAITRQFLDAIEGGLAEMPLERAGEFLEMAATLVRIKAQLLLPRPEKLEWEEDPRAELVRRLLEYEHFQDVVHVLRTAEAQRGRHFGKGFVEQRSPPAVLRPPLEATLEQLLHAAARIPEPLPPVVVRPPSKLVTVEEKVSLLKRLIRGARRITLDSLIRPWGTRAHAVTALLAALELARQQVVRIEQSKPFAQIWLFPGKRRADGPAAEEDA